MKPTTLEGLIYAQDWIRRGLRGTYFILLTLLINFIRLLYICNNFLLWMLEKNIEVASLSTIFSKEEKDEEDKHEHDEIEEVLIREI